MAIRKNYHLVLVQAHRIFEANPPDKGTDYFTLWLDHKF